MQHEKSRVSYSMHILSWKGHGKSSTIKLGAFVLQYSHLVRVSWKCYRVSNFIGGFAMKYWCIYWCRLRIEVLKLKRSSTAGILVWYYYWDIFHKLLWGTSWLACFTTECSTRTCITQWLIKHVYVLLNMFLNYSLFIDMGLFLKSVPKLNHRERQCLKYLPRMLSIVYLPRTARCRNNEGKRLTLCPCGPCSW